MKTKTRKLKPKQKSRRPGVPCPRCDHAVSTVLRVLGGGQRRRQCGGCGLQFTTSEAVVGQKVTPVAADVTRVAELVMKALAATPPRIA